MTSRGWRILLGIVGVTTSATLAHAQPTPCGAGASWIRVRAQGGSTATQMVEQLRSMLAARRVDLCDARDGTIGEAGAPAAELSIAYEPRTRRARLALIPTSARGGPPSPVTRTVPLASTPSDGRPLALAVAADELLRAQGLAAPATAPAASGAPDAPALTTPPPATPTEGEAATAPSSPAKSDTTAAAPREEGDGAPTPSDAGASESASKSLPILAPRDDDHDAATPDTDAAPNLSRRAFVTLAGAGELATLGQTQAGGDLEAGLVVHPRLAVALRAGARFGLARDAEAGSVTTRALTAGTTLRVQFGSAPLGIEALARFEGFRLVAEGHANEGATGARRHGYGALVTGGAAAVLALGARVRLVAEITAGVALRGVVAASDRGDIVGLGGAIAASSLGLRVVF